MMRICLALLLVLIASPLHARNVITFFAPGSCADETCTGFRVCQNFEGTGYDNSETWSENLQGGTIDEDDTTSPIGRGSQQLEMTYGTGTGYTTRTFAATSEAYLHFMFKTGDATPTENKCLLHLSDISYGSECRVYLNTNSTLSATSTWANSPATTTATIQSNTWYHIWAHWKKGTGSNGEVEIAFSETRTKPTSGNYYSSNSTGQLQQDLARIYIFTYETGTDYYDQVLVSTTPIDRVCP